MDKTTIETPYLNHIKACDWEYVYEPAEDSFLLLDTLEKDLDFLFKKNPKVILEVGSGSGVIITAISKKLNSSYCLAIDINSHACKVTKSTASHNQAFVDVIQADLTSCLKNFTIDLILFNPPYVVTPSEEITSDNILTKSWAGGVEGVEIIYKFLEIFDSSLAPKGFGYILLLKQNQPKKIIEILNQKQFECEIINTRKLRGEELYVLKFVKMN